MLTPYSTEMLREMNASLRKHSFEDKKIHSFLIGINSILYRKTNKRALIAAEENYLVNLFNHHIIGTKKSWIQ